MKILNWCSKLVGCISCHRKNRADHKLWSFKGISIDLLLSHVKWKVLLEGRRLKVLCQAVMNSLSFIMSPIKHTRGFLRKTKCLSDDKSCQECSVLVDMNFSETTLVIFWSWNLYSSHMVVLISLQYYVKFVGSRVNSQFFTRLNHAVILANGNQLLC